ncbi:MAG: methyl-accepting chemotaxis protein [Planctomycetota bacterium]
MRIATKITALACGFVLVASGTWVTTSLVLREQRASGLTVNLAGRQRMLTQRMTKEVLELQSAADPAEAGATRDRLAGTVVLFRDTLDALSFGGTTRGAAGGEVHLAAIADPAAREALEAGMSRWTPVEASLAGALADENPSEAIASSLPLLLAENTPLLKEMNAATVALQAVSDRRQRLIELIQLAGLGVTIALGSAMTFYLRRTVTSRLRGVRDRLAEVAEGDGDLTIKAPLSGRDELTELASSFNTFLDKMSGIVGGINGVAGDVAETSGGLALAAEQSEQALADQERLAQQVSAAVSLIASKAQEMAEEAGVMSEVVGRTESSATECAGLAGRSASDIEALSERVASTAAAVSALGSNTEQIGQIIQVIDDIAAQTNLLALNAAIEAARAGEHGRGFAVVADEVRKLADRTTEATSQIGTAIESIRTDTERVIAGNEETTGSIRAAVEAISQTAQQINAMHTDAGAISGVGARVQGAIGVQVESCQQLEESVSVLAAGISQLTSTSAQTRSSVASLADRAGQLRLTMRRFRVEDPAA